MRDHPYFALAIHDNAELAMILNNDIQQRTTLHEWPLSFVEKIDIQDGRQFIYKSQRTPSIEPAFYAQTQSPLLCPGKTIYQSSHHSCMILDYLAAPLMQNSTLSETAIVRIGRDLQTAIGNLEGNPPHIFDVTTIARWRRFVETILGNINDLITAGKFQQVNRTARHKLARYALSSPVIAAIELNPGYVHGDLTSDNIFLLPDGYRVIDWAYPRLGPIDLDLASLLESCKIDPLQYVDAGIVAILYILHIHWFVQCAARWIPDAADTYDGEIINLIHHIAEIIDQETA
jgi:hypothetical protein